MDMEVIQEFSENQCYLNALSQLNKQKPLELKLIPVTDNDIQKYRTKETIEDVLAEPIGKLLFRSYLRECNSLENLHFLDAHDEYLHLPDSSYRKRLAKKIIVQFLQDNSRQRVSVSATTAESVRSKFADKGATPDLFKDAQEDILLNLNLSSFPSFVSTKYYRRLIAFRMTGLVPVTAEAFTFIRILGEGGFGKVFAVSKNDTRALYACKALNKQRIAEKRRERLIINERDILAHVSHPFIVGLKYAFQDSSTLFLVQDLMSGGELGFHLNRVGVFTERAVQFYAAGIVLALEYFHTHGIVYRDLKPENIMLDADGYIRLTDLGLCSFIKPNERLHQHCGTRSYMAPEQCYGDGGYSTAVDWWSLGVTIFHFLTGINPFSKRYRRKHRRKRGKKSSNPTSPDHKQLHSPRADDPNNLAPPSPAKSDNPNKRRTTKTTRTFGFGLRGSSQKDDDPAAAGADASGKRMETPEERAERYAALANMYKSTMQSFPWDQEMSARALDLCKALINLDEHKRLGAQGAQEVKNHPFFADIDWQKLENRHISPPFVPDRDYVHAKFVESAATALPDATKEKSQHFPGFEYVRPLVFQEEIMSTIHNKNELTSLVS